MFKDAAIRAREYLVESINTEEGDDTDEFIELHIEALPPAYWQEHLGINHPSPIELLRLLRAREPVDYDDVAMVDFELPGDVSQYVLSVRITETGLKSISMES